MSRILVTGGAGFIGNHVVRVLLREKYSVRVLDNLSTGHKSDLPSKVEFIKADLREREKLQEALEGCEAVIHMAANIVVPWSVLHPQECFENNLFAAVGMLEEMRVSGVRKLIFSSSAAVYGEPEKVPIHEEDSKNPVSPYGGSKLAFENILKSYYYSYGIESVSLRYFNAYGPLERHEPETHVIPIFIKAALNGDSLKVTGKVNQMRDFVHVEDIARAHVDALQSYGLRSYNIGSGRGVTLEELITTLGEIIPRDLKVVKVPPRPGDPHVLIANVDRIKHELGWESKISLGEGLKETVNWFQRSGIL